MKKLTREERIGAATLAAVVLLIMGGALLMRRCDSRTPAADVPVTILYQLPDTTQTDHNKQTDTIGSKSQKRLKSKKDLKSSKNSKTEEKRISHKNSKTDNNSNGQKSQKKKTRPSQLSKPSRDPLKDSIPIKTVGNQF